MTRSFMSWNVNGLRACMGKGFMAYLTGGGFDAVGLQETKMQPEQADFAFPGYYAHWYSAEKKGYSGTLALSKEPPLSVLRGIGRPEHDREGRVLTLEFARFYFVTAYTPNAQRGLARLRYRCEWEDAFRAFLGELGGRKPLVVCGDLNVAHAEIDLKRPKANVKNAGFTPEERGKMDALLASGLTDTFRHLYPDKPDAYSWWSYMGNARANNVGWRIDYFLVSDALRGGIREASIHADVLGSDHCPVGLTLEMEG